MVAGSPASFIVLLTLCSPMPLFEVLAINGSTLQTLKNLLAPALLVAHLGQAIRAIASDFVAGVGVAR